MTDTAFGRLLYTDCASGTGRGGGVGFQVQAQSSGVGSQLSALATGWLLYEVQNAWITEQRPVHEFPAGFAHVASSGYGTGQSRYLGKEAMGGRQGNHLADCLVTSDPERYGTIRPAQLYGASFWRGEPWPTTDCPDFDGDLEPGPSLTLDELTGWARARPERAAVLARLLSVLEDPDGPRVIIVSADVIEAMRWLAAATLLLPQRRALDVTFKVFSANPLRAQQRVVAAPPEVNPRLGPGLVPGVFILDAIVGRADEAPVSDRAGFLAGQLGSSEADPYDLLDALELAGELGGDSAPSGAIALHAAWVLIRPDEPLRTPGAIQEWLAGADEAQLREHGPALVQGLLAGALPPVDMLRWLDSAVAGGRLEFDRETARTQLLAAELADAMAGKPVPGQPLPLLRLSDKATRDAESDLTSALLSGDPDQADARQFDRLLRLAFRHGIELPPAPLRERLHGFAVAWIGDPSFRWEPPESELAAQVLDAAHAVLRDQLAGPLTQELKQKLVQCGGLFEDRGDPTEPVYCHLQAAAITSLTGDDRLTRLEVSLGKISKYPANSPDFAAAAQTFQQALLDWGAADADVAVTILGRLSSHIDPRIGERANSFLIRVQTNPNAEILDMLVALFANRWIPPTPELSRLVEGERCVRDFVAAAASRDIIDRDPVTRAVRLIFRADPVVVELRASEVLDALLTTSNHYLAGLVLGGYPATKAGRKRPKPVQKMIALAGERMATPEGGEAIRIAVLMVVALANPYVDWKSVGRKDRLLELLRNYDSGLSGKDSRKWRSDVRAGLSGSEQLRQWDKICAFEPARPGGILNLIRKTES